MADIRFEWDRGKAKQNQKKHGISFTEATEVFSDENARLIDDPDHSAEEDRFIILGMSFKLRLLIVCHAYRGEDEVIRIISARRANRSEEGQYWRKKP